MLKTVKVFVFVCVISVVVGNNNTQDDDVLTRQIQSPQHLNGPGRVRTPLCMGTRPGLQIEGVCTPVGECVLRGGTNAGMCVPAGVCCIFENTCSSTTNVKLSYFVAPRTFQTQCRTTVNLLNRNVCQIRLDLDRFNIGQPTSPNLVFTNSSYQCNNDAFTVGSATTNLGFLHLCGENTGQHIYVPVNGAQSTNFITLNFQFGDRGITPIQPVIPDWRIRITQLECATNIQQNTVPRPPPNNNIQADATRIAPPGCLQYYTERSGTYESFNYNGGEGPYIGQTNYAICFRRTQDVCGIRHITVRFNMNYNVFDDGTVNCRPDAGANNNEVSRDYIHIPGGVVNNAFREFYCDSDLQGATAVTSTVPGPLHIEVRTDASASPGRREFGFRFNYQILSTGCSPL